MEIDKQAIDDSLMKLRKECGEYNWDGYGASPLTDSFLEEAFRFVRALPLTTHMPEVSIDPDGEVAFEWCKSPKKTFFVSIGARKLVYAGIFGNSETQGTEVFENEIPEIITDNIQRVFKAD